MQLPRGTFQGIKRDIGVVNLLEDLRDVRFTGSASFEIERNVVNLVFRKGKTILAESGSNQGDAALGYLKSLSDRNIDASLSVMTEPQLSLALEFNSESRVQGASRSSRTGTVEKGTPHPLWPAVSGQKDLMQGPHAKEREIAAPPVPSSEPPEIISLVEAIENRHLREKQEIPALPLPLSRGTDVTTPNLVSSVGLEIDESITRDLNALDAMDLDAMAEKIRTNCKFMVEKMNLGHLIEDDPSNKNQLTR
jgi:hypothetical protein